MAYNPLMMLCTANGKRFAPSRDPAGAAFMWTYATADSNGTVAAADYVADARAKGMKVGDWVFVTHYTSTTVTGAYMYLLMAIDADGHGDLSNGVSVAVTNGA